MKKLIATVATILALSLGAAGTAFAAPGDGGGSGSGSVATRPHRLRHPRWAALRVAGGAAADEIGVTRQQLREAVRGGQTVAELAEAHGVKATDVEQAIVTALSDALDKAVANGRVDEQRAAQAKEHLSTFAHRIVNTVPRRFRPGGAGQDGTQPGGSQQTSV
jgi:ABC-type sugar transport system substrate-binding protein